MIIIDKGRCFLVQYTLAYRNGREKMREKVILTCVDCLSRNYNTMKNKQTNSDRMVIKKFCRRCNAHTVHKETK